jgi:hypothetical protein
MQLSKFKHGGGSLENEFNRCILIGFPPTILWTIAQFVTNPLVPLQAIAP